MVLVNGTLVGFFLSFRRLRQGDLLSSFLFVMTMKALSCLIRRTREGGFILGFKVRVKGGKEVVVSYFLFANDTLIFLGDMQRLDNVPQLDSNVV